MEGINKKIPIFSTIIILGTIIHYLSIPLISKTQYIMGKIPMYTIVYLGGMLWGIIALMLCSLNASDSCQHKMGCEVYLAEQALKNTLTNLPNKSALEKRFQLMLEQGQGENFKILFIDVDGFKIVNDTLGYEVGDQILKDIASRLKNIVRQEGELFHMRGDEFLLLIAKEETMENIEHLAEEIIKSMAIPFTYKKREIHLTVSVGIAAYPWGGHDVNLLLKSARIAVQIAKDSGKSNYKIYDTSMDVKMNKKLDLINSLHRAVEKEEFIVYYQPQIDSVTSEVVGLEALVRWQNDELGLVPPGDFIPLAEETGLIIPIGDWVLRTACAQNKAWQLGYTPIPVSVNISALQFQESSFVDKVIHVLKETELDPKWLHLEITESIALKDTKRTMEILERLQEIGVKIALDDFGTGFSSLSYLNKFKINVLKIDSSFVRDIKKDEFTITKTIILLGKSLNMEVVAEGVETHEQLDYLKEVGCDKVQGYLFSRPVPPKEVEKMLDIA